MLPLIPIALTLAPYLTRLLAGDRAGDTAQAVAQVVETVTGTDDPAQAAMALQDPEKQAAAMRGLAEVALERERVAAAEMADARARDVALHQAGIARRMPGVLVGIGVAGAVLTVAAMLAGISLGLPEGGAVMGALIALAVGFLGIVKDAAAFEFGSSFGSRSKDASGVPFGQGRG